MGPLKPTWDKVAFEENAASITAKPTEPVETLDIA